jgi:hypothetical protein
VKERERERESVCVCDSADGSRLALQNKENKIDRQDTDLEHLTAGLTSVCGLKLLVYAALSY